MQGARSTLSPTSRSATGTPGAWTHPLLWAAVAALALCWLAQNVATEGATTALDAQWMALVAAWHSPSLDQAMLWTKRAHDPVVVAFIVGGIGLHACQRRWQQVRWLVAAVPGGMLANLVLKALVHRARPGVNALVHAHGYSFPSGHTLAAALMAGWLVHAMFQGTHHAAWRCASVAAGLALVCSVAFSRVYLGVHHPTDVLAAVLAGAAWLFLCLALQRAWPVSGVQPAPNPV